MSVIQIPEPLRKYSQGQKSFESKGETVGQALDELTNHYPQLKNYIFLGDMSLRLSIHIFLRCTEIRSLRGLETPLSSSDILIVVTELSGG